MKRVNLIIYILLPLMACLSILPLLCHAEAPLRIAILPFSVNASGDYAYLQSGLVDMLSSRLAWHREVSFVEKEKVKEAIGKGEGAINEKDARTIGEKLEADYFLFGSITVLGERISIDTRVFDVAKGVFIAKTYKESKGLDGIIPAIDELAADINKKVFGLTPKVQPPLSGSHAAADTSSLYKDPNRLLEEENPKPAQLAKQPTSAPNPNFLVPNEKKQKSEFFKGPDFSFPIKGIALGDIDGDKRIEVVFIDSHRLFVYRCLNHQFDKVEEFKCKTFGNFIAIDTGDFNGNGRAEIFVTSSTKDNLKSFVLESDGNGLRELVGDKNWYFRVLKTLQQGNILYAQKKSVSDIFMPGIFQLTWKDGDYIESRRVNAPQRINVFGFSAGNVTGGSDDEIVALDGNDHLEVVVSGGSTRWKSDEYFGGSISYLEHTKKDSRVYIPQRVLIAKMGDNGHSEVVIVRNNQTSRLFPKLKTFKSAEICSLSWDGLGLKENWKTPKIEGYVSDYAIGDIDNDGKNELVASVILKTGNSLVGDKQSTIISYDLQSPQ
ncbi:MAG: FG-GAP-like repeat-containing protein [Pseudomonadota bacterium]